MIASIYKALSQNPDDIGIYINQIVPQKIDREDPRYANSSDSFLSFLKIFSISPFELFNGRQCRDQFLSLKPPPIPQRKAAVQPSGARRKGVTLLLSEETMDVFEAGRKGRVDVLQERVRLRGIDALKERDEAGHTVGHWAALEGQAEVMAYLISVGGPYDAVSTHSLNQRPIHWACVNGFINVIEELLQAGVDINVGDASKCTPLIVSCQYGQTSAAAFLMARGAQLQECDADGDNALHWAAFRGRPELVRLLIYSGFNPHQRDNHGQSALHLACISGNLCVVRDLCLIDKVNWEITDTKGRTPLALAKGRRHDEISEFLLRRKGKSKKSLWSSLDLRSIVFGPPGRKRQPQLFFVATTVFLMYPAFLFKVLPYIWSLCPSLIVLFFLLNLIGWVSFAKSSFKDPGFIPQFEPEYDVIMRQVGNPQANGLDLSRLCHTCRIVKPLRSKHCSVCDRCVRNMDHHCPYIYNCVGYNNRVWFFCFIYTVIAISILSFYFLYLRLSLGLDFFLLLIFPIGLLGLSVVGFVGSCLWLGVLRNTTTNEMANRKRYTYLKNSHGLYRNPFDRGCVSNVLEYFHCRPSKDNMNERIPLIL